MGTQEHPPEPGAGARTLNGMSRQGGWDPSFSTSLAADTQTLTTALKCNVSYQTWTDDAGDNESLPINCVTWYDAQAFCLWDATYLPTEAEWNFAASGGSAQRAYPWSMPSDDLTIDCSHANYEIDTPAGSDCQSGAGRVGIESPKGDGMWGHTDLAGNVWEWVLDWDASPYATSACTDCANLVPSTARNIRGGSFVYNAPYQRAATRKALPPNNTFADLGFRCAKSASP